MEVIEDGHIYDLRNRYAGNGEQTDTQRITFVNTEEGHRHCGTTTQEAVRALIDRTQYCDACLPWEGNKLIVEHLRMVIALHEARALIRQVERGELAIETLAVRPGDQHLCLTFDKDEAARTDAYLFRNRPKAATETGSLKPGEPCHTAVDPLSGLKIKIVPRT